MPALNGRGVLWKIGNKCHVSNEEFLALGLGSEVSRMLCYDGRRPQLNDLHAHQDGQEINFPRRIYTEIESRTSDRRE